MSCIKDEYFIQPTINRRKNGDKCERRSYMRRSDLPVIIGKGMRKGVCAGRSELMKGGVDLYIVWLNRDIESGGRFTGEDVENVNAVLHFCDKESVKRTVDVLTYILMKWGDWDA